MKIFVEKTSSESPRSHIELKNIALVVEYGEKTPWKFSNFYYQPKLPAYYVTMEWKKIAFFPHRSIKKSRKTPPRTSVAVGELI